MEKTAFSTFSDFGGDFSIFLGGANGSKKIGGENGAYLKLFVQLIV